MTALPSLATVIVLYHPAPDIVTFCRSLVESGAAPVIVVNAAPAPTVAELSALAGATVIANDRNHGLAIAFNQGIAVAMNAGCDYIMLLDQDSRPYPGMAQALVARAEAARAKGRRLGAIGPVPRDRKRPDAATLAPTRVAGDGLAEAATIISSGMTMHRDAIQVAGGMWNELFIDHIDHEWCFRAAAAGFTITVATDLSLDHDIGDEGFSLNGRYKPIHRSPVRHFHIVRNTLWLARRSFIPRAWRWKEVLKLVVRMPAYLAFSTDRAATARALVGAVSSGFRSWGESTYAAPLPVPATGRSIS